MSVSKLQPDPPYQIPLYNFSRPDEEAAPIETKESGCFVDITYHQDTKRITDISATYFLVNALECVLRSDRLTEPISSFIAFKGHDLVSAKHHKIEKSGHEKLIARLYAGTRRLVGPFNCGKKSVSCLVINPKMKRSFEYPINSIKIINGERCCLQSLPRLNKRDVYIVLIQSTGKQASGEPKCKIKARLFSCSSNKCLDTYVLPEKDCKDLVENTDRSSSIDVEVDTHVCAPPSIVKVTIIDTAQEGLQSRANQKGRSSTLSSAVSGDPASASRSNQKGRSTTRDSASFASCASATEDKNEKTPLLPNKLKPAKHTLS